MSDHPRIETMWSSSDEERSAAVATFLNEHVRDEAAVRRPRPGEVVCIALDGNTIVGVSAVRSAAVPLVGGRTFWVYRSVAAPDVGENVQLGLFLASYEILDADHVRGEPGPIGLFVRVGDPELLRRRREPIWEESKLMYVGYTRRGLQARVRYFTGAWII